MEGFDLSTITDLYVGQNQYRAIYKGSILVWQYDTGHMPFTITIPRNSDIFGTTVYDNKTRHNFEFYTPQLSTGYKLWYSFDNGDTWHECIYDDTESYNRYYIDNTYEDEFKGRISLKGEVLSDYNDTKCCGAIFFYDDIIPSTIYGNMLSFESPNSSDWITPDDTGTPIQFEDNMFNIPYTLGTGNFIWSFPTDTSISPTTYYIDASRLLIYQDVIPYRCFYETFSTAGYAFSRTALGCSKTPSLYFNDVEDEGCYKMFYGINIYNGIIDEFVYNGPSSVTGTNAFEDILKNNAEIGRVYCDSSVEQFVIDNILPDGWVLNDTQIDYSDRYTTIKISKNSIQQQTGHIYCTKTGSPADIYYSTDYGTTWNILPSQLDVNIGETIRLKRDTSTGTYSDNDYQSITCDINYTLYGNIESLVYGDNFIGQTDLNSKSYIFNKLFENNTKLTDASGLVLPATTLTDYCYHDMFYGCTNLQKVLELPATILTEGCYSHMFMNCQNLKNAPELLSETLTDYCYTHMFYGCSKLNYIKCLAIDKTATNCIINWVGNVASSGTFIKHDHATWTRGVSGIPSGWLIEDYYINQYLTLEALEPGTFGITIKSGTNPAPTYYSLDNGTTWNEFISGSNVSVSTCDKMLLKRDVSTGTYSSNDHTILTSTANFNVYGNSQSMIYSDNFIGTTDFNNIGYAFSGLFKGNTHLIEASNLILPATTVAIDCYYGMFQGCTSLTTSPAILPAAALAGYCYSQMFQGCTSLTTAPALPATSLATYCYSQMFQGCTSLTTAPALPATLLYFYCYKDMFNGCTSLTSAPALPATSLGNSCYWGMFSGCTSLTTAPELPATSLRDYCYYSMFYNCTSLTTAPELPATTLASNCYRNMFNRCTSLNYIKCLATDISATNCTSDWVANVAATGIFVRDLNNEDWTTGNNGIPTDWEVEIYNNYPNMYMTLEALSSGTIKATKNGSPGTMYYSVDNGNTWINGDNVSVNVSIGDKVLYKCNKTYFNRWNYFRFKDSTADFKAYGNIMSIVYGDNFRNQYDLSGKSHCFYNLFNECGTKLKDVSNLILPATTLADNCYYFTFANCTSITTAPELPATTLADGCYRDMFSYCSSLTTPPELPATNLADSCYAGMLSRCTSLTTAPDLLATTLISYCYTWMFYGDSSLNYIKCLATTNANYAFNTWTNGVSSSGTLVRKAGSTFVPAPSGWTVIEEQ